MNAGGIRAWLRSVIGTAPGTGSEPQNVPPEPASTPPASRRDVPRAPRSVPPREATPIHRADYMPPEREAQRFALDAEGLPTGRLARRSGQLVILADGEPEEMVNPRSTRLYRLGIYSFRVRGVSYHEAAVRSGNFSPGSTVRLVREPTNVHDPNAIAVYAESGRRPAGYVNRQNAARIAKRLDAGEDLATVVLSGGRAGDDSTAPVILVASPASIAHLRREL